MSQDITIAGASYSDVPAIIIPKTNGGNASFVDVTPTTASSNDVAQGKVFFQADGTQSIGISAELGQVVSYPVIEAFFNGDIGNYFTDLTITGTKWPNDISANVITFMNQYARSKYGTDKNGHAMSTVLTLTSSIAQEPVNTFLNRFNKLTQAEYYGYVTTQIINNLNAVELGRNTNDNSSTPATLILSDSIENYSALMMQGHYKNQFNSTYNTTMLYLNPETNKQYWAGMKDRNSSYDCFVTFTDDTTASLTGGNSQYGRKCVIWGIP